MSKYVVRKGILGIAKEASRGVGVNPTFWIPSTTMGHTNTVEEAREEQGQGVIADSDSKYVVMKMAEGDIETQIYDKALGLFLYSLMGSAPTTTGSNPYTHAYTLSNDNQHGSLSLYWKDPNRSDMYTLAVVNSLGINVETSGIVNYTVGFMSKVSKDWTEQTPNLTSLGNKFLHQHVEIRLADTVGGLSGASPIKVKSLDVTLSSNTVFDSVIGTVEPEDVLNQQFSVEGSLNLNDEDDTYRDYMTDGTYKAMEIKLFRSSSSSLTLQFPRVDFSEWERDGDLNEIAKQNINFKANYDQANALDIVSTCSLINAQSSY